MTVDEGSRVSFGRTLEWAAFLACSWTWCIGMFLPVLLIRDFGGWSFAAFAVPNIVGAAAMGLVLRVGGMSERMCDAHARLMHWFSAITVAFQWFFLILLCVGWSVKGVGLLAMAVVVVVVMCRREAPRRWWGVLSAVVFAGSLACVMWWFAKMGVEVEAWKRWPAARLDPWGLLSLSPCLAFGFLLCPYLDRTFHIARQRASGAAGSQAFVLGFGVLFAVMIGFTFVYAGPLLAATVEQGFAPGPQNVGPAVAVHMALQLGFTIGAHEGTAEMTEVAAPRRGLFGWAVGGAVAALAGLKLSGGWGLSAAEIVYRAFMGAYGLVFPAYVWLCVLPSPTARPTRRQLVVWGVVCVLGAPVFAAGFIAGKTWWLLPALAGVVAARLFIGRRQDAEASAST